MITIETAATPLEFAYCSVKRLHLSKIGLLREVALQYGKRGTTNDIDRAIAILDEVRGDQCRRLRQYENMVVYPRLAADYHYVGRHDIAMDIIEETLQHSRSLLVRWEASIYLYIASVCNDIGEHERCDLLLYKVAEYVESVPRIGRSIRENYWIYDLFSLYLRLEMVDAAESLAAKMVGSQRVDALSMLAFHGQPDGQCNEYLLATAMERSSEYSKALVASLMVQSGQFGRATAVLDQITRSKFLRHEPMLEMVKCMLQRRDSSGALELLDRLLATPHAVTIDSDHLAPICALLHESHADMLHKVLDHLSRAVQINTSRLRRLAEISKLVRFLAPYSHDSAEAAVDQLFDECKVEVERGKNDVYDLSKNTVLAALHALSITIDKYGLSWSEVRREVNREILGRIPIPRRFEYADLFRPHLPEGTPAYAIQHPRVR